MRSKFMIKRGIFLLILLTILLSFYLSVDELEDLKNNYSRDYYVENGYLDTSSENLVTGIYLDYRLFDTIFETSILLIAITGIIFLASKHN